MSKIYVASSWRNPIQQEIVGILRADHHEVYDFMNPTEGNHGFHWEEVNPDYKNWNPETFREDLYSGHPSITRGFKLDKDALDWCDTCILLLPCGRSAHLEAGYCAGRGKRLITFLHPDKFEPELMYLLGDACVTNLTQLLGEIS